MKNEILKIEKWIKEVVDSAQADGVVIGMSGGKDSLVVAKLCIEALGTDKVFGVIMPNGEMSDKSDAEETCELLQIPYSTINIENAYNSIINSIMQPLSKNNKGLSNITTINTAPRVRMTTLYAIAGSMNYLVANTSNLSETMIGYSTKWGDNAGDFAPIANFTKTEVCKIGLLLGLPKHLVCKTPSDGLSGKSDEERLGFSYENLDKFIRTGEKTSESEKFMIKHKFALHKINGVNKYQNSLKNYFLGDK
ncbi:MAG: NAD(+) synthase [Clostridia bacterium]|nr:NAD(+) synthase [Clostridia bacterium]